MTKPTNELTTTYTTSVISPEGRVHTIKLRMWYTLAESGIGWYEYWGEHCYDRGELGIEDYVVQEAYLIREGVVDGYQNIPKLHGVWNIRKIGPARWAYVHHRELPVKHWAVEMAADAFADNYKDWDMNIPE